MRSTSAKKAAANALRPYQEHFRRSCTSHHSYFPFWRALPGHAKMHLSLPRLISNGTGTDKWPGPFWPILSCRRVHLQLLLMAQHREKRPARASYCTSVAANSGSRLIPLHAAPITASVNSWNRAETHFCFLYSHSTVWTDFFRTTFTYHAAKPCGGTNHGTYLAVRSPQAICSSCRFARME